MISREDARHIVYHLDPARLARMTYRAAARGLAADPAVRLTSAFADFVDVSAGRADSRTLMLRRRIKPSGDLRLLLRLPKLFG